MDKSIDLGEARSDEKYGIRLDKYISGGMLDSLKERLEGVLSFGFNVLFPVILSGVISLGLALLFGYLYDSLVFGILFFAATIPVFLFGVGSLGLAKAVKDFVEGISFLLGYSLNVSKDIRQIAKMKKNRDVDNKGVANIALNSVVFPVAKNIASGSLLGGIVFSLIKKIVKKCMKDVLETVKDELTGEELSDEELSDEELLQIPNKTYQNINGIVMKAVKGIAFLLRIVGALSIALGLLLVLLLFIIKAVL